MILLLFFRQYNNCNCYCDSLNLMKFECYLNYYCLVWYQHFQLEFKNNLNNLKMKYILFIRFNGFYCYYCSQLYMDIHITIY